MRSRLAPMSAVAACLSAGIAHAQTIDLSGYADATLADTPGTQSWNDGGLGKVRWGGNGSEGGLDAEISALLLEATARLPLDLDAMADIRYDPHQKSALDLLDASVQWRPPAAAGWGLSGKAGAFFPPFGLENRDIGWTSPWTLTDSALGSWVGEELRTIGGEGRAQWRGARDTLAGTIAVFGWNDPAGVLLADRGWALDSRALGLFDRQRLPDAPFRASPAYTTEFDQIGGTPGWYAGVSWDRPEAGHLQLYRYDNEADPAAERAGVRAWHTTFWALGATHGFGPFYVIAEAMAGDTAVQPGASPTTTGFQTAYLLGGWTRDSWRAALRLEEFGTSGTFSERGQAITAALNWSPRDWLRLAAEVVAIDSVRSARALTGQSPHQIETEPQLAMRLSF